MIKMKKGLTFFLVVIFLLVLAGCKQTTQECSLSLCDCKCYPKGQTPEAKTGKLCGINCLAEYKVSGCALVEGECVEVVSEQHCTTNEDCIPEEPLVGVKYVCDNSVCKTEPFGNPAAQKCLDDGGTLEPIGAPEIEESICVFDDESICRQWHYYNGICEKGECFKECRAIGSRSEGWYDSCSGELIQWDDCG